MPFHASPETVANATVWVVCFHAVCYVGVAHGLSVFGDSSWNTWRALAGLLPIVHILCALTGAWSWLRLQNRPNRKNISNSAGTWLLLCITLALSLLVEIAGLAYWIIMSSPADVAVYWGGATIALVLGIWFFIAVNKPPQANN